MSSWQELWMTHDGGGEVINSDAATETANRRLGIDVHNELSDKEFESSGSESEDTGEIAEEPEVEEEEEEEEEEEGGATEEDLKRLTVAELKKRLKELQLPVSGKKAVLINRLLGREKSTAKVTEWKKSKAKVLLSKLISDEKSKIHTMTPVQIHKSHPWFCVYNFGKFKGYLETIQGANEKLRNIVKQDEEDILSELTAFPRKEVTNRGIPFWDSHIARALLEKDVRDGKAEEMKPKMLWKSRREYKDFPEEIFSKHVHQEKRRQREEPGWIIKRNKKALKTHEDELIKTKAGWDSQQHQQHFDKMCEMWEGFEL